MEGEHYRWPSSKATFLTRSSTLPWVTPGLRHIKPWSTVSQGSSLGSLLFVTKINELPNSSEFLSFKIFADDTNVFASGKDLKALELQMNLELKKAKEWCDTNKLSINLKKTNFMIIKPIRKKNINVNINITNL